MRSIFRAAIAAACLIAAVVVVAPPAHAAESICKRLDSIPVALSPGAPTDQTVAATLCTPPKAHGVQVLLHGATYSHNYWDFPKNPATYSYVRAANRAGFATLNVDRLGYERSSHPISTSVNVETGAYVVSQLVQRLRDGRIGKFTTVFAVGHSMGTFIAFKAAASYQSVGRLDAVLATGLTHALGSVAPNPQELFYPATQDPKFANSGLDAGYVTTKPGSRGVFYSGQFDPKVVAEDEKLKDTVSASEFDNLFAWLNTPAESNFTRDITIPVLIVVGAEDGLTCNASVGADCGDARELEAFERPFFPKAAKLKAVTIPGTGHDLNLHRTAPGFFATMQFHALTWTR